MLKSKVRGLAVTVAAMTVAVFALLMLFGFGNGTAMHAYAEDNVDSEGRKINSWTEVNIQSATYGDNFITPTVKPAYLNSNASVDYRFYKVNEATGQKEGTGYPNMDSYKVSGRIPAGKYLMEATVTATDEYTGLKSTFNFNIATAANRWTKSPDILRWAENEEPHYPEARAAFGEVSFTIRGDNGNDNSAIYYQCTGSNVRIDRLADMKAGYYILSASVNSDAEQNYTGIPTEEHRFRVFPSIRNEWKVTPSISDWTLAEAPSAPVAEALYSDGTQPDFKYRQAGAPNESATSVVPTTAGSYVLVVTARAEGFVDLVAEVPFNVTKAQNSWTTLPAINGWTEGETPNAPIGEAEAGQILFRYLTAEEKELEGNAPPTEVGDYLLEVTAFDTRYETMIVKVPFSVARDESKILQNSWVVLPNIQGWREGQKANDPVGEATAGTVTFTYRNSDGVRVERPNAAGNYVLVATVEAEGYAILVGEVAFTVTDRIVIGDNAEWIAGICVLSAIVLMLIVACVILFIRSKGLTVKQVIAKILKK